MTKRLTIILLLAAFICMLMVVWAIVRPLAWPGVRGPQENTATNGAAFTPCTSHSIATGPLAFSSGKVIKHPIFGVIAADRVLVVPTSTLSANSLRQIVCKTGGYVATFDHDSGIYEVHYDFTRSQDVDRTLELLKSSHMFILVQPSYVYIPS